LKNRRILITNDDGIHSEGLWILKKYLSDIGEVFIVAPDRERSATGHAITLHRPLRMHRLKNNAYAVDGTPTDCVILAYNLLFKDEKPDLVISGINKGGNLGDDITYSGTVCAAIEGAMLGIPSFAISIVANKNFNFKPAAIFASILSLKLLKQMKDTNIVLNVNIPYVKRLEDIRGIKIARQGKRKYEELIVQNVDPRGKRYYWIGGNLEPIKNQKNTDISAISAGYISITPVSLDMTDYKKIPELKKTLTSLKYNGKD
jgi:5'-nucleotidase